jgi:hypothetical protein
MRKTEMIRKARVIYAWVLVVLSILSHGICSDFTFDKLRKDPLGYNVMGHAQEEGSEVYLLVIDINGDGLNDALIGQKLEEKNNEYMEITPDWWIYLKVQGGYKQVTHTVCFNTDYIAMQNTDSGTRVITFFENGREDRKEEAPAGSGHIYWFDSQKFYPQREKEILDPTSDTFKTLFANNYADKITTLSQTEINRFYEITVFPAGKRRDYNNQIIKYQDLPTLPRTDPNSDTTGTLLTYGIILGNHTTSETLQLQAKAEKFARSQRTKSPEKKKIDAGKDASPADQPSKNHQDTQAPPVSQPNPPADKKEKK